MAKKRILIVDDEVDVVEALKNRLQRNNYEVLTAYDGEEALGKARKENLDLIILDLMLPKIDGYKVCGLLKADTRYSGIPVIMFTAKANEADMKLGKEVGADAYVSKTIEDQRLLSAIEELLDNEPIVEF